MPYNPSTGVYSLPAIYLAIPGTVIIAAQHNTPLVDLQTANNYERPVIAGGTGAGNPTAAATNLEIVSYGSIQVLTEAEKQTVRDNIGASAMAPYQAKSGNYTIVVADDGAAFQWTSTGTASFDPVASLGANFRVVIWAAAGVTVTIDPNGSETINGAATLVLHGGQRVEIWVSGSNLVGDITSDALSGPQIQGLITGLRITNNGADATNDIDIAVGSAASDTSPYYLLTLSSAITKRIDASWAVGTNQGGLDTGAVGNGIYYIWEIQRSDTGVTDALISLSSTAPTMPANYDRKALIGKMARTAGVNNAPRSYSQKGPTPWVAYTPTITSFGTATGVSTFSRQNAENIEIMCKFTVGTPTAVEARLSLGFNGVDSNIVSDAILVPTIRMCGLATYDAVLGVSSVPMILIESNVGYVTFGLQSTSFAGLTKRNGNVFASAGWTVSFQATIPISGW